MVGIVTGTSLGLGQSSLRQLGSSGQLGDSSFGIDGENVFVNAANGNLVIDRTDTVLTGVGPDDDLSLAYNSLSASSGYGANNGWQTNDAQRVFGLTGTVNTTGSTVSYVGSDGTVYTYTWNATDNAYVCNEVGESANRLTFSSTSNTWTLVNGDSQEKNVFDNSNSGRIISSTDANGNSLTYTYTGSLLTQVTDQDGEYVALSYTGSNLTSLTTYYYANQAAFNSHTLSTQSVVSYTYDSQNRLSTVTVQTPGDLSGGTGGTVVTTYGYQGTTDLVTSISQTGGAQLTISYTLSGSNYVVSSVQQTTASGVTNTTSFSYSSGSTQVTDNAGNVTTLSYNGTGELTQIQLPPAQSGASHETMSYTYNSDGDVLAATDGLGNVTTYTYDGNDNLLTATDPLGNVTSYTYDSNNHVLTDTITPGTGQPGQVATTRYVYDTNENLRFAITGDGGVTQYLYNSAGQQTSAITCPGDVYNLSGLTSTQSPSLTTMTTWAAGLSDLSTSQRIDTTYDFRGNVATVTSYSAANSSGVGLTTAPYTVQTYVYDPSGRLLSKQTSGIANSEVYTYDALGRVLTASNLEGNTTTYQYNNSTDTTIDTTPNGATTTSVYNLAGQLLSTTVSGSSVTTGTTSYAYDSRGNLAMVTDADGNKSFFLYDNLGRKVADVAADGSITQYQYNADNQLTATTAYATRLTSTQMTSLVSSGVPTDPPLSTILPSSSSSDVWNWRIYDTDGRLIETINGDGDATVNTYDASSNLIQTTSYANVLSGTALSGFKTTPPTTLQLPTADPGFDDTARYFYNNEGQVIATLDGNGYLTQSFYDASGQKIEILASANAVASSLRASGTLSQLITSAGTSSHDIATHFVYDDEGNLRYTINANLIPTEYDYDNTGRLVQTIAYAGSITAPSSYTVASIQSAITTAGLPSNTANRTGYSVYDTTTGNLDYSIDAMGDVTQYRYDAEGNVIKVTQFATLDPQSSLPTQATIDSWASAHSTSSDRIARSFYNAADQLIYSVNGAGYVTQYSYDAAGHVTSTIQYGSAYTVTDSTTLSGLATLIGSPSPSTYVQRSYSYDADGRVTDTLNGLGIDTHVTYDAQGRVSTSTVAYGLSDASTTAYTYDAANNVATVTRGYGTSVAATTGYTYDGMGNVLTMTDPDNHTTTYTYDALGDVLTVTDPTGAVTTNTYDAFGNVLTTTDALGNTSYYFYDLLNRLALTIDPMGYATATAYTIGNEIASVTHYATAYTGTITPGTAPTITTSGQDATTTFTRDNLGRVTKTTDAMGNTETETYDAFGDKISCTNQLGGTTTYTYDARGLMLSETLPETSTTAGGVIEATSVTNTYSYDSRGNLTQKVEASGLTEQRTTTYTYDKLNRLTSQSGDTVTVTHNDLTTTTSVTPTTTYFYDDRGNLIQTVDANANLTTHASDGATFNYYDALNRKIATVNAVGTLSEWTYDANGNVTAATVYGDAVTLPSSLGGAPPSPVNPNNYRQTTYTYDKDNRVLTSTIASVLIGSWNGTAYGTSTSNLTTTNVYDAHGNLVEVTDPNGNSTFTYYDKSGRKVAQVDPDKYLTVWTLDSNGNVTNETRSATQLTMTPTTSSTVAALQTNAGTSANDRITGFTYDLNGNRLTETRQNVVAYTLDPTSHQPTPATGNSTITYTYNGLGEVTSQVQATGDATTYTYDSMGRQTQIQLTPYTGAAGATVKTTTAEFYDGLNDLTASVVYDADNLGTRGELTTYTYGPGGRLATMTEGLAATMSGGQIQNIFTSNAFTRTYGYDADGNTIMSQYSRVTSNGTTLTEADVYNYDALGRQSLQTVATYNGTTWSFGDQYGTQYDVYGEVSAKQINGVTVGTYAYNNAGQLWRTNDNNGSVQMFIDDADGNQTLEIDSSGVALPTGYSWSTLTLAQAISLLTGSGAHTIGAADPTSTGFIVTITGYDARSQATKTVQPFRELSWNGASYVTQTLTTADVYDAFGDVTQATDARGNSTNYAYNTLGKMLTQVLPSVSNTAQNGGVSSANPTITYYYDISGRQIGTKDANGNTTTQSLLANTGYQGGQVSVVQTFDPDQGVSSNGYDVFGNVITERNQDYSGTNNTTITNTYDSMNRLIEVANPVVAANSPGNPTSSPVQLIDYYAYDGLGQRILSWNSELNPSFVPQPNETPTQGVASTDYDAEGRVIQQTDPDGYKTTYSYAWSSTAQTSGLGTFGGWVKTTVNSAGLTETETDNPFGTKIDLTDFSGTGTYYGFDLAGRLTDVLTGDFPELVYTYFNTGKVSGESESYSVQGWRTLADNTLTSYWETYSLGSTYAYDANGNRTAETTIDSLVAPFPGPGGFTTSYENATATWDALNRMTSESDTGYNGAAPMTLNYSYDLNGNVVEQVATYRALNTSNGAPSGTATTQTEWFSYDSMNRETIYDGTFTGTRGSGTISAGTTGSAFTYDAAGNRKTTTNNGTTTTYTYDPAGQLAQVANGSTLVATYTMDAMGRVTDQKEYNSAGTSVVYEKTAAYDADSNITSDQTTSVQGSNTIVQDDTYSYVVQSGYSNSWDGGVGAYQGGSVTNQATSAYKNGVFQQTSDLESEYFYTSSQQLYETYYTPNTAHPTTQYNTTYNYTWSNLLTSVSINDGSPRTITYAVNLQGQILQSSNSRGPVSDYYLFSGVQEGYDSNNGTNDLTYSQSITQQTTAPGTGFFTNGAGTGTDAAQFGTTLQQINGLGNQSVTGPTYTVQQGDTLESIAQELWGDSSYWYLLADANGITDDSQLVVGQTLNVPTVVAPSQNNATTNTVYNQSQAIGNVAPTHPPIPSSNHGGCGVIGEILEVIVAVVVAAVLPGVGAAIDGAVAGALGGAIGATAAAVVGAAVEVAAVGAISDAAAQGFGLLTGIQSKFSWAQVGDAAISALVGGPGPGTDPILAVAEGAIGNALTQGIEVATGLEKKFDWAGVAAAGIADGATNEVAQNFQFGSSASTSNPAAPVSLGDLGSAGANQFGNTVIAGMAGILAGAAARSLITGTSFGDNIMRVLPNAIGQTIGNAIASDVDQTDDSGKSTDNTAKTPQNDSVDSSFNIYGGELGASDDYPQGIGGGPDPNQGDGGGGSTSPLAGIKLAASGQIASDVLLFGPSAGAGGGSEVEDVSLTGHGYLQPIPNNPNFYVNPQTGDQYQYDPDSGVSDPLVPQGGGVYLNARTNTQYSLAGGIFVETVVVTNDPPVPVTMLLHYYSTNQPNPLTGKPTFHGYIEIQSGSNHFYLSGGPTATPKGGPSGFYDAAVAARYLSQQGINLTFLDPEFGSLGAWAGSDMSDMRFAGIGPDGNPVQNAGTLTLGTKMMSWTQAEQMLSSDAIAVDSAGPAYDPGSFNSNSVAFSAAAQFGFTPTPAQLGYRDFPASAQRIFSHL